MPSSNSRITSAASLESPANLASGPRELNRKGAGIFLIASAAGPAAHAAAGPCSANAASTSTGTWLGR